MLDRVIAGMSLSLVEFMFSQCFQVHGLPPVPRSTWQVAAGSWEGRPSMQKDMCRTGCLDMGNGIINF